MGIVICHDGKIFVYSSEEEIGKLYYELTLGEYRKQGCDNFNAQEKTLRELSMKFDIDFMEVK